MHSSLLLTATTLLSATAVLTTQILNAEDVLSRSYASISTDAFLVRRQDDPSSGGEDNVGGGLFNATTWTADTHAACQSTLSSLRRSPNPSGSSVCFNLPSLDTATGVFEADLRLYRVFPPSGPWEGVEPQDVDVGVAFPSAMVTAITEEDVKGMGLVGQVRGLERRQSQSDGEPELMQAYLLVGQIKEDQMRENMSM